MLVLTAVLLCAAPSPDAGPADAGSVYDSLVSVPGLTIDSPAPGAALTGRWTALTGHFDRTRYQYVAVVGRPASGFYEPMGGHGGVPMVPLIVDADGGFVAPKVPLSDGVQQLAAVPIGRSGYEAPAFVSVTASGTSTDPITLTAEPRSGETPLKVKLTVKSGSKIERWEWASPDGGFEPGPPTQTRTFTTPGLQGAAVRGWNGSQWVYDVVALQLTGPAKVLHETRAVTQPSLIRPVLAKVTENGEYADPPVRWVLVIDGDQVRVFDGTLKPAFVLKGFKGPKDVAGDPAGRIWVADTGHDRVMRFTPDGKPDVTFGTAGALTAVGPTKLKSPMGLVLPRYEDDGAKYLLGDGLLYQCGREECSVDSLSLEENKRPKMKAFSVPMESELDYDSSAMLTAEGWQTLGQMGAIRTISKASVFSACGYTSYPYFVAAQGSELLEYWNDREARRLKLPFAPTAIAGNPRGTLSEPRDQHGATGGFGPIHLYVAGKGVLQERVVDRLERTP